MKRPFGVVALVTGGAQGIGRAICEACAGEGASVAVADVRLEDATKVAAGIDGLALHVDVTDPASNSDGVRAVERNWDGIDILVNNAGIFNMSLVAEIAAVDYRRQYDVNVGGTIFVTQAVVAGMKRKAKGGATINLASQAGRRGEPNISAFCSTKAAVISITQSFALELSSDGIRANAIAPGVVDTPMWDTADSQFARYEDLATGEKKRRVGEAVPLGHMGRPEEIADPCVFLASAEARCITGQTLNVDGGNRMS